MKELPFELRRDEHMHYIHDEKKIEQRMLFLSDKYGFKEELVRGLAYDDYASFCRELDDEKRVAEEKSGGPEGELEEASPSLNDPDATLKISRSVKLEKVELPEETRSNAPRLEILF